MNRSDTSLANNTGHFNLLPTPIVSLMPTVSTNRPLRLSVGNHVGGSCSECAAWLVVGRSSSGSRMVPIIVKEGIEALRGETCYDDACH